MISTSIYGCITEEAITRFKPTWLMIKQHKITGLKYFCKTVRNPYKYPGSGLRWSRHLKKHGKEYVQTIWCQQFTDIYKLVEYALTFSDENGIVASKEWANLIPENGLGGGWISKNKDKPMHPNTQSAILKSHLGIPLSEDHKAKLAITSANTKRTEEWNENIAKSYYESPRKQEHLRSLQEAHIGVPLTAEHGKKISLKLTGRKRTDAEVKAISVPKKKLTCPHCGLTGGANGLTRYHFNNCKVLQEKTP